MQVPVQITFRGIPHSDGVEEHIQEKVDKLQHYCSSMISCHVVLELENKTHHTGNVYNTRVTVTVPGKELVSTHNGSENMYIAIRDGFEDMTRQLERYIKQVQGNVKSHEVYTSGKIVRLFNGDGYGFIEGVDGTEFYFNMDHLTRPTFNKLTVGMPVHFVEGMGDDGPQAHHVKGSEKTD